jgi:hypothetical protein
MQSGGFLISILVEGPWSSKFLEGQDYNLDLTCSLCDGLGRGPY